MDGWRLDPPPLAGTRRRTLVHIMTTWVLLRGLMREERHWGEFPALFQKAFPEQRVVTLDWAGNGRLHDETSARSVAEMAEYCRMQLKQLGHAPPYAVLALSLGAMVAVEWGRRHPEEVDRLVLINTSLAPYNPFYHRLRPKNYPALIRSLFFGSAMQREKLILRLTSTRQRSVQQRDELLQQWISYAEEYPVTRANVLRQFRAAMTFRAAPSSPSVPVLLLAGQHDRLVNMKCSTALADRWGCEIRLHPTAGHDLPLDDAAWVVQQAHAWAASS